MSHFEKALWDGSDPTYAPCLKFGGRNSEYAYWVAPPRFVKAGWQTRRVPLGRFDRSKPVPPELALRCRELTQEIVRWYDNEVPKVEPGTWKWLIGRYQSDEFSPYQSVKANTREGYAYWLGQVEAVMGKVLVAKTTYEMLMRVQQGKEAKGRSTHHIHSWFSALRRVARYGVLIEAPDAARVSEILSNMRIPTPAARQTFATHEHVMAIVQAADQHKLDAFAAGILIQWWFGLRAVDVRGQRLDGEWADGLTWGMFSDDFSSFQKVISKTRKSLPQAYTFDVSAVPGLRERLANLNASLYPRLKEPDMPIALSKKTGKPYTESGWNQAWRRMRKIAGVPADVWMMDTRAGAITEASQLPGVSISELRNAAQHKDATTTGRYIRSRSDDLNKVVSLRATRK